MKQNLNNSIKYLPIDSLHPYTRNARTHSGEQIDRIAASIQEFGFLNPILIDSASKTIIAGHGRLLAAQRLGLDKVPTVAFAHLTDTQRRAYTLADNKLALEAGWDEELLKIELDELRLEDFDLDVIGFDWETQQEADAEDGGSLASEGNREFTPKLHQDDEENTAQPRDKLSLIVFCEDEDIQRELFAELKERGFKVKV
jgi:hypothetical protein